MSYISYGKSRKVFRSRNFIYSCLTKWKLHRIWKQTLCLQYFFILLSQHINSYYFTHKIQMKSKKYKAHLLIWTWLQFIFVLTLIFWQWFHKKLYNNGSLILENFTRSGFSSEWRNMTSSMKAAPEISRKI